MLLEGSLLLVFYREFEEERNLFVIVVSEVMVMIIRF